MSRTVCVIGPGERGAAIARLAIGAGLRVVTADLPGPDERSLHSEVTEARVVAVAVAEADWVVVSIPFWRFRDLEPDAFRGKTVLDTTNYDPERDHAVSDLLAGHTPEQILQKHLAGADLVKAASSILAPQLERLSRRRGALDRSALPIAGNSQSAREETAVLLDLLGWDAASAGVLSQARLFGPGSPSFVEPYLSADERASGPGAGADLGRPANVAEIRRLLLAAAA